ncbi:MAG: TRAP transporter fused permease subunit [Pseudomonadota bacterium]
MESPASASEPGPLAPYVAVLAVVLSLYQLWQPIVGFVPAGWLPDWLGVQGATTFRPVHLCWVLALGLLAYPLGLPGSRLRQLSRPVDVLLALAAVAATVVVLRFDYRGIDHLLYGLASLELLAGGLLMLLALEVARRSVGLVMMLIGLLFIGYAALGNALPDALATRGFSLERIVRFQVYTGAGMFGSPLGIAAGAVFMFVLFGAFLESTGAGRFFINLAFAAAGKYRGGPAKASVLASAAMGSISGSAIANTVTTGSLTIPMMKQLGYSKEESAGIEASASTGGQIMPPVMGAGAFVMAEFTRTAYGDIVWMSLVPALLYFFCVLLYVHLMASRRGLSGMSERESALAVMLDGAHFLLPLLLITALLLFSYSPVLVGATGCAAIVLAALLRAHTRIGFAAVARALERGARMAVPISCACAVAGIVVGVIGQTGLGLQFTEFVLSLADGRLWLAFVLIALAALVLGMGLPVTAAYIVLSVMAAPALQEMGMALVAAHMVIFWLSQTSNVTPPIALAAFAGAGVAGARPMGAAFAAVKLSTGLFIVPLMMVYSPLLLTGDNGWADVLLAGSITVALIVALAIAFEGWAFDRLPPLGRVLAIVAAALLIVPSLFARLAGAVVLAAVLAVNAHRPRGIVG